MTEHITQRLSRIQKALKAPKEANKNVAYKSRSAEQILEAAKEHLMDGEVIRCTDEIIMLGDRFYVKATAELWFGAEYIPANGYAREDEQGPLSSQGKPLMQPPQVTGASSSYARKYALGGLFAIDDSKDDPDKNEEAHTAPKKPGKISPLDKTGNPAVDRGILEAINMLVNTPDEEALKAEYTYHYKLYKDSGATQEQLDLLEAEKDKHKDYLRNKNGG